MKKLMKKMMVMIMAIAMALTTAAMPAFAAAPQGYTITSGGVCSSRRVKNGVGKFSVRFGGKKYSAKMYKLMDGSLYVVYTNKKTEVAARYVAAVDKFLQ